MGMAASQARWLALTARKTNVEYEGQQVNQARTALANKSANTFNELLALEVPTAPSTQDFTKLEYTYKDGTITETIDSMSQIDNDPEGYNYMVTHYHYSDIYTGIENRLVNPQVAMGTTGAKAYIDRSQITEDAQGNYSIHGNPVTPYNQSDPDQLSAYETIIENYPEIGKKKSSLMSFIGFDGNIHFTMLDELEGTGDVSDYYVKSNVPKYVGTAILSSYDPENSIDRAAYEQICRDWGNSDFSKSSPSDIYKWVYQGQVRYACLSDLLKSAQSGPNPSTPTENQDKLTYYTAEDLETKVVNTQKAIVDINQEGRIETIRYEDSSAVYSVTTNTVTDTQAYDDAMNQYHYNMEVYEKRVADINAKTEKLQEQDRTLELRLRQLDTEQEALQTEMEAVKKVIDKNIESTFKTFES